MALELVIFDCDGVLVDSERIAVRLERDFLDELGWSMTVDEVVARFVGRTSEDFERIVAARLGLAPDWYRPYEARYREAFERELAPVPSVVEAIDAIEAMGLATAVASSGTHEKMRLTLGIAGLFARFDGRITSVTEVSRGKPHPDVFELAASRAGVAAGHCVVVEDSASGVEAAKAADMRVLAFAGGVTPADRLRGADAVFHDMRELPDLVAGI